MIRPFGVLADGGIVESVTLGDDHGLQAEILTYGGILRSLTLPVRGQRRQLVLSLPDLAAYVADASYQGALIGRCANRIAGASCTLEDRHCVLAANEGEHHLHGGHRGFGKRLWQLLQFDAAPNPRLLLQLQCADGEEGYPGALRVTAEFSVTAQQLDLRLRASSDRTTVFNPTYHPYFNLTGDPALPVDSHRLRIAAGAFLPVTPDRIPTGERRRVDGTTFDFRALRSVRSTEDEGFDHCWTLDAGRDCDAELHSPQGDVSLRLSSNQPGLQFYTGQGLTQRHPGWHGLCLEPGGWPNAVNEAAFPSVILEAGAGFEALFHYRFSTPGND
ncbi:MAG: aldose epimerase family protein [Steroidobacteraceae bacterium]